MSDCLVSMQGGREPRLKEVAPSRGQAIPHQQEWYVRLMMVATPFGIGFWRLLSVHTLAMQTHSHKRTHTLSHAHVRTVCQRAVPCFPREEREINMEELKLDDDDDGWVETSLVGEWHDGNSSSGRPAFAHCGNLLVAAHTHAHTRTRTRTHTPVNDSRVCFCFVFDSCLGD